MATNKILMNVDLYKNANGRSASYGKYFGRIPRQSTLNTRGLAEHIAHHGSLYTLDVLEGVLRKLAICIPELVGQGIGVKIDGLGTFFPTLENKKGGVDTAAEFNVGENIKGIHVRFQPEGIQLDRLTSRAFKEKCEPATRYVVTINKTTVEGKVVRKSTYTPVAEYVEPSNP
jgi:predicted histone-like DNA-binding protein